MQIGAKNFSFLYLCVYEAGKGVEEGICFLGISEQWIS